MTEEKKKVVKKPRKGSKAQAAKAAESKTAEIDDERMQNVPVTVGTSIGEFEITELPFFPFIRLARKQIEVFWTVLAQLDFSGGEMTQEQIVNVLGSISIMENFEENICEIIAAYCQEDANKFEKLMPKDMQVLIPAIVSKIDTEALRDFFTQTLPSLAKDLGKEIQTSTEKK